MNGILFGAVHLPAWDVALVAMVGGAVWSSSYDRHRSLPPLALSHGILGATYFSWVRDGAFVIAL
jgi:membrane protease YdiL (CAAX protease family)